MLKMIYRS